jgi:hypothetical protein
MWWEGKWEPKRATVETEAKREEKKKVVEEDVLESDGDEKTTKTTKDKDKDIPPLTEDDKTKTPNRLRQSRVLFPDTFPYIS